MSLDDFSMRLRVTESISKLIRDVEKEDRSSDDVIHQETVTWNELKELYTRSGYASRGITLKRVCHGSSIDFPRVRRRRTDGKSPELVRHLEMLQRQLDQKQYDAMVKDVTAGERLARERHDMSFSGYKDYMRFGVHVMSIMAVFFMVGYAASYRVFHSESLRILCGVVLMFCGMVMETILLVIKENKITLQGKKRMNIPTAGGPREKPHKA